MDGGPLCARWTLIFDARHALDFVGMDTDIPSADLQRLLGVATRL
jgi:hypothetical protein